MFIQIRNWGLTSNMFYVASMVSVFFSIAIWALRLQKTDRPAAERFGIFVGLWAPTLMIMGKVIEDEERLD